MRHETSFDLNALAEACRRFRLAIERTDSNRLPVTFEAFPRGSCGDAALLLAKYLEEIGFGIFQYMLGSRAGWSHAWLQQGSVIVDITADQFGDVDEKVIVTTWSPWHIGFSGEVEHVADYQIYDENTRATLGGAYHLVRANVI